MLRKKNPRVGGIIICTCADRSEAERIASRDPFFTQEIADYEIIEFAPTKFAPALEAH
ncbi:YciI family protein [Gordonibacter sp.]|uniref:YciI family protein n=1 Tax=Gordonibacter sp. TaxID=1968902 RepID=UPI003FA607EA